MWRLIALFSLGGTVGCLPPTKYSTSNATQTDELVLVTIGENAGYLIDPRTQTCLVWSALNRSPPVNASGTVDCAKLKASVPEAAPYITWDSPAMKP
jgi:hypothetical protein